MKRLVVLLVSVMVALNVNAQDSIEGSWTGKLDLGTMSINLVFNFTESAEGDLVCTFDSPDQGARGIPATLESGDPANIKVSVAAIGATYEGVLTEDGLRGTFRQHGYSFPLSLKRGALIRNRPQTPRPPFPYTTEEVSFSNDKAGAVLAGTLTLPAGHDSGKPVPVLIMVTGSGFQNRDEEIFEHKPFLVIADYLARNGIASLRYDDRGYAKSTGDFSHATTEDFMEDAAAGVQWLRDQGDRFSRIGVIGHSEGATIAFMLGAEGKVDFIVSLAGPAVKGDTILARQTNLELERRGMSPAMTTTDVRKQVTEYGNLWQKFFIDYDPAVAISAVRCPVMAVQGSEDRQVEADLNFSVMESRLPRNGKNLLKRYDGLNHLLQHCSTGYVDEYEQIEETIAPEVLEDIVSWIKGWVTCRP